MAWEPLPIVTDEADVTDLILQALRTRIPGWEPQEGQLDVAIVEEVGRELAVLRALTVDVAAAAVVQIGRTLFDLPQLAGAPATLQARLTLAGTGRTAPAGLTVIGRTPDGIDVAFTLASDATAAGLTVDVPMTAASVGSYANDVPPGPLRLLQASLDVVSAEALLPSDGGLDPEADSLYLDRLTATLGTLRQGFVHAADAAVLARSVPGVHRALGLDGYNPGTDTFGNERTVTVVPIDSTGQPVSTDTASAVQALLEELREINFLVFVDEPTYTAVNVAYTAVAELGADPLEVQEAVHTAGLAFLDPARWAEGDDPSQPVWQPVTSVRYLDLARVLGSAPGVAYLSSLTINGGTADLPLTGRAPLPAPADADVPSTVTGSVT